MSPRGPAAAPPPSPPPSGPRIEPASPAEAAEAVARAVSEGLKLTPLGLGGGGAAPPQGALAVSAARLSGVASVEPGNLLAAAGAGTTPDALDEALAPTGLYWPVTGLPGRTLGAIMNEGLLGAETMARGPMIDWVLGATMVDAAGRLVSSGGRTLKNVSGYDLTRLCWRARGSLALSVGFILKLLPRPKSFPALEWRVDSPAAGGAMAERIILARIRPEALRVAGGPGPLRLIVWLCGFPETVADHERRLEAMFGRPSLRREDGFAHLREHGLRWPPQQPDSTLFQGTRRALLDLLERMLVPSDPPESWRMDVDLGGGRALLGPSLSREAAARGLSPLGGLPAPDELQRRVKAALDPGGVFLSPVPIRAKTARS